MQHTATQCRHFLLLPRNSVTQRNASAVKWSQCADCARTRHDEITTSVLLDARIGCRPCGERKKIELVSICLRTLVQRRNSTCIGYVTEFFDCAQRCVAARCVAVRCITLPIAGNRALNTRQSNAAYAPYVPPITIIILVYLRHKVNSKNTHKTETDMKYRDWQREWGSVTVQRYNAWLQQR